MLGRAVKEQVSAPAPKNESARKLATSTSSAQLLNIEAGLKRQSSQSLSGFLNGGINSSKSNHPPKSTFSPSPLSTRSPNIARPTMQKTTTITSARPPTGLSSVLGRSDSFNETPDTVIIPQDRGFTNNIYGVEFNEQDFDNDSDVDLDMEYELPSSKSMPAPPKPSLGKSDMPSNSSRALLQPEAAPRQHNLQGPSSSAMTWSSSPLSHHAAPPASREHAKRKSSPELESQKQIQPSPSLDDSSQLSDINPRPSKRRTLPWAQRRAEEEAAAARDEEDDEAASPGAIPPPKCFRCKETGHFLSNCTKRSRGEGTEHDYTTLPKDKSMPWNNTASAMKERQKQLKEKHKLYKKGGEAEAEALEQAQQKKLPMAPIFLSEEQRRVLSLVVDEGKSVFFTGSAGTGKSVLMRAIIAELRKKFVREPERLAVTASTGLAACNIGGITLHSFGGIGLGKEDIPTLVKKIRRNPKAKNRWLKTKVLIIDEISMVDGDLFDKLEGIARTIRNNGRPFGGIQLAITGDFFQLPPVPDFDNKSRGAKFAFDAGTWSTTIHHTIGLTEVFRQKDPVFANMLNEMRLGKITDDTVKAFRKLSRPIPYGDGLLATELFPTRNEVENSNALRMRDLHGKLFAYPAVDTGTITDQAVRDKLLANMMAPKTIELKKGAQVMLIKNMDDGLVNGSLGKVVAFQTEAMFDYSEKHPEVFEPGASVDDQDSTFRESLENMFSRNKKDVKPSSTKEWPRVRFCLPDGTTRDLLVQPEEWKIELPNGEIQAQRSQLPLILAWALSIHKAQGQTLERVKIDLKKIFEKGQAYVALSRATSQAGLEVQNFDKSKVMAHPRVADFYNTLYSINKALQNPKVANPSIAGAMAYEASLDSRKTMASAYA